MERETKNQNDFKSNMSEIEIGKNKSHAHYIIMKGLQSKNIDQN